VLAKQYQEGGDRRFGRQERLMARAGRKTEDPRAGFYRKGIPRLRLPCSRPTRKRATVVPSLTR